MNCDECRKKVALIVDDDPEFRKIHGPATLGEIFGEQDVEIRTASAATSAIRIFLDLQKNRQELVFAIVDMHMPPEGQTSSVLPEAGIFLLNVLKDRFSFSPNCRAVVYTAYPNFENCVKAINAGADDYIPKFHGDPDIPQGPEHLIKRCKALLDTEPKQIPPPLWVKHNREWVQDTFEGKWVAIMKAETGKRCGLKGESRDGMMIISDNDYYHLLEGLLGHEELIEEQFTTWLMPSKADVQDEEM